MMVDSDSDIHSDSDSAGDGDHPSYRTLLVQVNRTSPGHDGLPSVPFHFPNIPAGSGDDGDTDDGW